MSLSWIEYEGIRILYNDLGGLSEEATLEQFSSEIDLLQHQTSPVPMIVNIKDAMVTTRTFDEAKKVRRLSNGKIGKQAILGVDGMKGVLLLSFASFNEKQVKAFNSEEDAKNWLVHSNN